MGPSTRAMSVERAPEPVPSRQCTQRNKPDSTTRQPGFRNRLNMMTDASSVKMICVRVLIEPDHSSAVGFSMYTYLFPAWDVI